MDRIYKLISGALADGRALPDDFNILRIAQGEEYPVQEDDGIDREFTDEGVRQGEFDAVVSRLPGRFTQHLLVNFRIATILKKGIIAYSDLINAKQNDGSMQIAEKKVKAARAIIDKYETITIADKVLSQVVNLKTPKDKCAAFGRYLAKGGDSILQVKFGLAMLGFFGNFDDKETVMVLGKCEELTYFAAKALSLIIKDEKELSGSLVELASCTKGWGKVAAMLELPDKVKDKDQREWIVAHGNENVLGLYILAVEAAIKGNLGGLLLEAIDEKKPVEGDVAKGACNIIEGLFQAENVQGADSFTEVPDIGTMLSSFAICVSSGLLSGETAETLVEKLKEKNYVRG